MDDVRLAPTGLERLPAALLDDPPRGPRTDLQSFLDTNDGGRDGAFAGVWKPICGEELRGQFVVLCKFTSRSGHSLCVSDLSE